MGRISFFPSFIFCGEMISPIMRTISPAAANLAPAKTNVEGISEPSIPKSLYPIFIHGNALPQSIVQNTAAADTNNVLLRSFLRFIICACVLFKIFKEAVFLVLFVVADYRAEVHSFNTSENIYVYLRICLFHFPDKHFYFLTL